MRLPEYMGNCKNTKGGIAKVAIEIKPMLRADIPKGAWPIF